MLVSSSLLVVVAWLPLAWLDAVGPLLLVVIWVIRQILVANAQAKEEQALQVPGEAARADVNQEEAPARSEVEKFLREIGAIDDADPGAEVVEREPTRKPIDPFEEPAPRQRRKKRAKTRPSAGPPRTEAAPLSPSVAIPVAEHHLVESQLAEQASHLGERVALADDRLEARLQEKFDHGLGKLEERGAKVPEPNRAEPPSPAERVASMLRSPEGVRDAVVLGEILTRPDDRW